MRSSKGRPLWVPVCGAAVGHEGRPYVIPSRRNIGTFTRSSITANTTAAASVAAIIQGGSGVMAKPPSAKVEAIRISAKDDATSQLLGRDDHRWRRSRLV
jgi:hypothetical protein